MSEDELYGTFIVTEPGRTRSPYPSSHEVDWSATYRDDPSRRHWADRDGSGVTTMTHSPDSSDLGWLSMRQVPCQELVIEAANESQAENVCSLVLGGILLAYPDAFELPKDASVYPTAVYTELDFTSPPFSSMFTLQRNIAFGVEAAKRAWNDINLIYSIEKYRLSLHLDWFTLHSAAPRYGQKFSNWYPQYSYHAQAAYAIVVAYSIVEELGLEVRSSAQNPRFLGENKDQWNPKVKEPC